LADTIRDSLQAALSTGYTLGRELGGGGMSRVWTAHDTTLGRDVVVKLLSPDLVQEMSVERFTREVRLAANLQHAHIVPLLTAGVTNDGRPYYLMPYVEGESLRARLGRAESANGLPIDEVVSILRDVCRALAYAHARGVVHRDIKPDNVLVSGGAAVVADFGIAKAMNSAREPDGAADGALTRVGTALGSPTYMSPEQGSGDPDTDHRTDIYALGVTAYELLTGKPPFEQRGAHELLMAHFTATPVDIRQRRADVPDALAAAVMACLAKNPDDRPQSAELLATAIGASLTASGAISARTQLDRNGVTAATSGKRRALAIGAGVALLAVAFGAFRYIKRPAGIDSNLIAVMPFTVRDNTLQFWREGLVDLLSRSLDGAGSLRTVAASTTISQSPARADAESAAKLGRAVGAGLVLFGDASQSGRDSVHLRFALYDVGAQRTRYNFDVRGESSRMDALADSMAMRVMRELGSGGNTRFSGVGTRSLPAMRAFLQGQQYYRRGSIDSSRIAFTRALEADSTFALAWRGVASVFIRQGREDEPDAVHALDMAIRYKSGRSPRDSMLLRADSLRLAFRRRTPGAHDAIDAIPVLPALFESLQRATAEYPSDAELWFELGDAAFHFGELHDVSLQNATDWFERGVALDSTFVVPSFHLLDLATREGNTVKAALMARRIERVQSGGPSAPYYSALATVLESRALSARARELLDSLPSTYAAAVLRELSTMPDSGSLALTLTRDLMRTPLRNGAADPDSTVLRDAMALAFAARGHGREALQLSHSPSLVIQLARLHLMSADSVAQSAREWLRFDPRSAVASARLLAQQRDTASLTRLVAWTDSVNRAAAPGSTSSTAGVVPVMRAYRALAAGDSAGALRTLLSVPMTICGGTPCAGSGMAELLVAAKRPADAARALDRWMPSASKRIDLPLDWMVRARIAEQSGDVPQATTFYRRVVALWKGGDAAVQQSVTEATEALQRLTRR
jgi:eukaryotic-like serine/threonine-protein kinase